MILRALSSVISSFSYCSVVRGRVVTAGGRGLTGVRVQRKRQKMEGFTLTQKDGWFDLMVNGGGGIKLEFSRTAFVTEETHFFVGWNEVRNLMNQCRQKKHFIIVDRHHRPTHSASCVCGT